jgi:predicted small integral membrane protein
MLINLTVFGNIFFGISTDYQINQYVCKRILQYCGILQDMITRNRSITLPQLIVTLELVQTVAVYAYLLLYACSVRLIEGNNNNKQAKTNKQKERKKQGSQ